MANQPVRKWIGKACFVAGTPILMADDTLKAIEQVEAGDTVMLRNESTGEVSAKKVAQTFVRDTAATLALTVAGGEVIETTSEHPFYVEGYGFKRAGEIGIGTSIVTRAGPSLQVLARHEKPQHATVYNLEVEEFHTYFVGNSKLWVHNLDCDDLRPGATEEARRWLNVTGDRPAVAASMGIEVDGVKRVFSGASSKSNPDWYIRPEVHRLYDMVPAGEKSPFHKECAEVYILSQMFEAGINPYGKNLKSMAVNIRPENLKHHGSGREACKSCKYVIGMLSGVDLIGKKLNGKYVGGP